jgi:hypothetical protein
VARVGGGWHGGNVESVLQHELAYRRHHHAIAQPSSLNQRFVLCSRVKRNACKRVIKSTQTRNGMYDTICFSAASGRWNELSEKRSGRIGTVFVWQYVTNTCFAVSCSLLFCYFSKAGCARQGMEDQGKPTGTALSTLMVLGRWEG